MASKLLLFLKKHMYVSLVIFGVIILVLASGFLFFKKDDNKNTAVDTSSVSGEVLALIYLTPSTIYLPVEPLSRSAIEFSRIQKKQWDESDFDLWYEEPTKSEIEVLHKKNEKTIKELLEAVP